MNSEFHSQRNVGLGGSDIAAVLGIESAFKTAFQIWDEKVNKYQAVHENIYPLMLGRLLEKPLLERYGQIHGKEVISGENKFYTHPEYEFLIAHIDGFVANENRILEIKTADEFTKNKWGLDGSADIPEHYYAQIAHYMLVMNYEHADLMVGFISQDFRNKLNTLMIDCHLEEKPLDLSPIIELIETRTYSFKRNTKIDEIIIKEASNFWNNYVIKKIPPIKDFTNKRFIELVKSQNISVEQGKVKIFDEEMLAYKNKYVELKRLISNFEIECESILARFKNYLEDSEIGEFSDGDKFIRKIIKRKESFSKGGEYVKLSLIRSEKSQ